MHEPYVLDAPSRRPWWSALERLERALADGDVAGSVGAHASVVRALIDDGSGDLARATASALLFGESAWANHVGRSVRSHRAALDAPGVAAAVAADVRAMSAMVRRGWRNDVERLIGAALPGWDDLVVVGARQDAASVAIERLATALREGEHESAVATLCATAGLLGAGPLARHLAYAWDGQSLVGVAAPASARIGDLVGLERTLEPFLANVEAFLTGRPALATLLYGPRGSGKSTTVRGLLERYATRGLRLVEVSVTHLEQLPAVLDAVSALPQRVVLMLDDLAFDDGDARLRPLKSLLEGSLLTRRERVLVVATSNRRHLVRERHGDRPDPLERDVHAWDTHHDRLALADRFGLTITFPATDQRAYLAIVEHVSEAHGLPPDDTRRDRALRFAAWGNGLSGRTAHQFVERERATAAERSG